MTLARTLAVLVAGLVVFSTAETQPAAAAQAYSCMCDGVKTRFLASSRYCEKQSKVKACNAAQWSKVYSRACVARGCRYQPPVR